MRFSKSYSKLKRDEFTTIRKDTGYYYPGKKVKVTLIESFSAKVVNVKPISKSNITENLAQSDADCSRQELIAMLEKWYGKKCDNYVLITLRKV